MITTIIYSFSIASYLLKKLYICFKNYTYSYHYYRNNSHNYSNMYNTIIIITNIKNISLSEEIC